MGATHQCGRVYLRRNRRRLRLFHIQQVFNIPLRPFYRGKFQTENRKTVLDSHTDYPFDHFQVGGGFPHHTFFAHFIPTGLKLRLDQTNRLPTGAQQ